ncbi:MAG: helix-turn-helix transcriptional regulator [Candidatus Heimdallarchaeota archaeon]|nr:MAG: helix-turn-helix transcriptional regulator [Candidatus Heimdallarchaeota archaeon]
MYSIPFKKCPVKVALSYIGKKWSIEIIRDMMFAKSRFKDFLKENPQLTSKVLAQRLKELEKHKIITKTTNGNHLTVEYHLTERGFRLNKVLYELALFSYDTYLEELFENENLSEEEFISLSKRVFQVG